MMGIIITIVHIIILLVVIFFSFNQIRDIIALNKCSKEFERICDDCERWRAELDPKLHIDMMLEHLDFLSGYGNYFDNSSAQLKYINDYREKLINKYKHNIPSMVSEHRSKRLKQILK
jgi:hypothetical protein